MFTRYTTMQWCPVIHFQTKDVYFQGDDERRTLCEKIAPKDADIRTGAEVSVVSCPECQEHADRVFLDEYYTNAEKVGYSITKEASLRLYEVAQRYQHRFRHAVTCGFYLLAAGSGYDSPEFRAFESSFPPPQTNNYWSHWAVRVLRSMKEQGVGGEQEEIALRNIITSGMEPYHSLKGFAVINDLE